MESHEKVRHYIENMISFSPQWRVRKFSSHGSLFEGAALKSILLTNIHTDMYIYIYIYACPSNEIIRNLDIFVAKDHPQWDLVGLLRAMRIERCFRAKSYYQLPLYVVIIQPLLIAAEEQYCISKSVTAECREITDLGFLSILAFFRHDIRSIHDYQKFVEGILITLAGRNTASGWQGVSATPSTQ